ncbi:MAG: hypothetical protein NTV34_02270, partial [Proteobacteria bacterium]|nr:hypothetical protein [Pseudomonadota bacterium]
RSGLTVTRSSSSARQSLGEDHLDFEMVREGRALQMTVLAHEVPSLIDEIPALAVAATACPGVSEFCGLGELRVKESDRLYEIHQLLSGAGVETSIKHDNLSVAGQRSVRGFNYHSEDHRLVMAAMILATSAKKMSTISPTSAVKVSFPSFFEQLAQIYR